MLVQAVKLLLGIAALSYRTTARCAVHQLEDIKQQNVSSNVEKINFDQIITNLLHLISTTEQSKFERISENFIIGEGRICEQLGKGLTLEDARWVQGKGIKNPIYLALKYVDGNVLTYDFESKTALLLHNEEILLLLENYKITSIEQGQNNDLYLQENEINSFDVSKKYVCQANTLLLQNGQRQDRLIQNVYYKIRQIFQTNNILTDIISKPLHQCCSSSTGVVDSNACLSQEWTPKIKTCFKNWSNILERNI